MLFAEAKSKLCCVHLFLFFSSFPADLQPFCSTQPSHLPVCLLIPSVPASTSFPFSVLYLSFYELFSSLSLHLVSSFASRSSVPRFTLSLLVHLLYHEPLLRVRQWEAIKMDITVFLRIQKVREKAVRYIYGFMDLFFFLPSPANFVQPSSSSSDSEVARLYQNTMEWSP